VNLALVEEIRSIAARYDAMPAQVALAWVLARGEDVVPIPGTKRRRYLEENIAALRLELTREDLDRLSNLRPVGDRYSDMSWAPNGTPPRLRAEPRRWGCPAKIYGAGPLLSNGPAPSEGALRSTRPAPDGGSPGPAVRLVGELHQRPGSGIRRSSDQR
jgi:Aldo/keto reductase family